MTAVYPTGNANTAVGNFDIGDIEKYGGKPTDAFGEVEFRPDKTAKYVRVSDKTSVRVLYELLTDYWGLKSPNFIISVIGGAKNFTLTPRMTDMFRKSLVKAAEKTGAWITTGGTHTGVMKHVGKAVKNYAAVSDHKKKVVTIGIATWGVIFEREKLVNQGGKDDMKRYHPEEKKQGKLTVLDHNHSHFILVDNDREGTVKQAEKDVPFGGEIALRTKLENHIAQLVGRKTRDKEDKGGKEDTTGKEDTECREDAEDKENNEDIEKTEGKKNTGEKRMVCVMLQGGPNSLNTVHGYIIQDTPVVIIDGSGGCADVLARASEEDIKNLKEETVEQLLKDYKIELPRDELTEWTKKVRACVQNKRLLSVFKLDPTDTSKDLDITILEALLKANYGEGQPEKKLRLVLEWNRSDIARSVILNDDTHLSEAEITQCFSQALESNKSDFCKALLEYGVDVKSLWTVSRLKSLYKSTPKKTVLYKELSNIGWEKFTLRDIGKIMRLFMDNSYVNIYNGKPEKYCAVLDLPTKNKNSWDKHVEFQEDALLDDPYREIFQWAILAGRRDIARYVWEYMLESIPAAIVATEILKNQASQTSDHDRKKALKADAAEYEKFAVGVLGRCFEKSTEYTTELLVKTLNKWGGCTCLHVAVEADDKLLVSSPAVQHHFDEVWMGSLEDNTPTYIIISCIIFPLLIFHLVKFKEEIEDKPEKSTASSEDNNRRNAKGYFKQLYMFFFSAPVVTFWLNVIFFLAVYMLKLAFINYLCLLLKGYLCLFASVLLRSFTEVTSGMEYSLIIWLSTFALEEIREIVEENERHLKDKFIVHIWNLWNVMDIISLILVCVGFGLRFNAFLDEALLLYCISFMIQCVRIIHIFAVHHFLGPKIIMVGRMLKDLLFFLFFLVVFLLAYGVASQALLYPNESNIGDIVVGIIYKPYWNIYGELFLDEINYNPNTGDFTCSNDDETGLPPCPQKHAAVPVLSAIYLLFVNVLLLNLLIAMFSYSLDKVERQGNEIWKFQRYSLITDYYYKPKLPPPLIVFCHIWRLCKLMKRKLCNTSDDKPKSAFKKHLKPEEQKRLNLWERWHAEAFLQEKRRNDKFKPENQLSDMNDRFESLMSTVENLQDSLKKSGILNGQTTDGLRPSE